MNFLCVEPFRRAQKPAVTVNAVAGRAEKYSQAQGQAGIRYLQRIVNIIPLSGIKFEVKYGNVANNFNCFRYFNTSRDTVMDCDRCVGAAYRPKKTREGAQRRENR